MKVKINKLPKSIVEIEGELEAPAFEAYFAPALQRLGGNLEIPGFRKGKAPEAVLLSKIPEIKILEEMAGLALNEHYPKILVAEKIDAIGAPEITLTKLARGNPLGFKIKTAVLPEVELPDYKKIAGEIRSDLENAKRSDLEVTDEDVENTIMDIRKSRAPKVHITHPLTPSPKEGGVNNDSLSLGEGQGEAKEELPELNDEFARSLGPFQDVADFKAKLKENIKLEKEIGRKEKTRLEIAEKIINETKIDLPEILIDAEVQKILYQMESDIARMGLKFEEYLKHINKNIEDLKKEFQKDGEKKAKLALILNRIAAEEKITAPAEEVAQEVAHILEHYKDADPERARMHAENVLTNEKIFQFLESQ